MTHTKPTLRVDKWLWYARFFKTRSLASKVVSSGHVRVNSNRVTKPAHSVEIGNVLTFPQGNQIRVVEIVELGSRRGPAAEAQGLYCDHTPPTPAKDEGKTRIGARPTKKQRRDLDRLREG